MAVSRVPGAEANTITGDDAGNLWLSGQQSLLHVRDGRLVERLPGRPSDGVRKLRCCSPTRGGGLWLGSWQGGGVSYFKDGRVRAHPTRQPTG